MALDTATTVEAGLTPGEKRHFVALEKRIDAGLQTFREVGAALLEIRDSRLYRESHASFDAYCAERWQLDRNRAYQLIGAAEVVKALGDPKELTNEAQARELATVLHGDDPSKVKTIWERVRKTEQPVTAALIREVKQEVMAPEAAAAAPTLTDSVLGSIDRLTKLFPRWMATKPPRKDRVAVEAAMAHLEDVIG